MSDELKPCPFCGSTMESFAGMIPSSFAKGDGPVFAVDCDCQSIGPFRSSMEGAISAWNTRTDAITPQQAAEVNLLTFRDAVSIVEDTEVAEMTNEGDRKWTLRMAEAIMKAANDRILKALSQPQEKE